MAQKLAKFGTVIWQKSAISKGHSVGETERQIFCQSPVPRSFSLCAQNLMKSTLGVEIFLVTANFLNFFLISYIIFKLNYNFCKAENWSF